MGNVSKTKTLQLNCAFKDLFLLNLNHTFLIYRKFSLHRQTTVYKKKNVFFRVNMSVLDKQYNFFSESRLVLNLYWAVEKLQPRRADLSHMTV